MAMVVRKLGVLELRVELPDFSEKSPVSPQPTRSGLFNIAFMHTSRPIRVMHRDEYHSTPLHEFGLERPRCAVVLSDGRRALLEASFGTYNPQELLQYMQLRGDHNLYLMSRFVGQAWEHLGEHMGIMPVAPSTTLSAPPSQRSR